MRHLLEQDRIELIKIISLQFIELKQRLTSIKKELYKENLEPAVLAEVEKECSELENMCLSLITNLDYLDEPPLPTASRLRKGFPV